MISWQQLAMFVPHTLVCCYHLQVDAVLFLLAGRNETERGDPEVQPRGGGDG